ncbi:hypothetical protein SDC9_151437 [bioreactor metagenome]|uniref:Uncharacterized protein n=1 Tax=bioreactor metagenome TaxID=1076179 RepID=A0A645EQA4_9ZZZZ
MVECPLDSVHQQESRDTQEADTRQGKLLRLLGKLSNIAGNCPRRAAGQQGLANQQVEPTDQDVEKWDRPGNRQHHGDKRHQCHQCREREGRTGLHHVFAEEAAKDADRAGRTGVGRSRPGTLLHGTV